METTNSKRFSLNVQDLKKIGIGALVAISGAALTYLAQYVADTDFGQWTPLIVAAAGVGINAARKFLASYE